MHTLGALLLLTIPAAAQSFNIDVGDNTILFPVPPDAYAAAAGQAGRWTASIFPYSTALTNLDGTPSGVTTSSTSSSSYNYFPSTLTGDDRAFMVDIQNLPALGGPWSWTFSGLSDGRYVLYTYAWAPENSGALTRVSVPGSPDGSQDVGGLWSGGAFVLGTTHARHTLDVSGGVLFVQVEGVNGSAGSVNGFQLVATTPGPTAFCFGDGLGAPCPCGNSGAAGRGCANSVNPAGARLVASGTASVGADTLALLGVGMPNSSALFFQGTTQQSGGLGVAFGDGLRCAGGTIVRLATKSNAGGASTYPTAGDASVAVRGGVAAGDVRTYQIWYRNAADFCLPATFNLTNGVQVPWGA
ncbi:MAG: hypothetical protein JNK02_09260 [Planctomycetes bacterium]|nr:hypothetical protein [Planctomycetota bacterium]